MNAVMASLGSPVFLSSTVVCANTVRISAKPPFEIQIFVPFKIQCEPSGERTALLLKIKLNDLEQNFI